MRGDNNRASSYLARFWGTGQDRALTALFGTDQEPGLITNAAQLIDAAANLAPNIGRKDHPTSSQFWRLSLFLDNGL